MSFTTSCWDITKSIAVIGIVLIIGYCGFKFVNKPTLPPVLDTEKIGQVVRTTIQENNKYFESRIKYLEGKQNESLKVAKERDEKIKEVGTVVAGMKQTVDKWAQSNHTYKEGTDSKHAHEFIKIYKKDVKGNKYPVAWAMYHPNREPGKRWKTGTYPIDINATVIETENEKGNPNVYVDLFAENNQMKETKGKQFPLDVKDVKWVRKKPKDKKFSFNTRLGFSGFVGSEVIYPGVDISLFSYGRTKRDLDWRFASFGLGGANDEIYGYFSPIQYNIGNFVPLVENMYIGPFISVDGEFDYLCGGGMSVLF